MKAHLEFDLSDDRDYVLWSKIVAALQGTAPSAQTTEAPTRAKLAPQPAQTTVSTPQTTTPPPATPAPTAAAPAPQPAPAPAPAPQPVSSAPVSTGNGAIPTIQELRECLAGLGAVTSAGEAADFLRSSIGSPNLSSIPEDRRVWAKQLLMQEIANRQAMA